MFGGLLIEQDVEEAGSGIKFIAFVQSIPFLASLRLVVFPHAVSLPDPTNYRYRILHSGRIAED